MRDYLFAFTKSGKRFRRTLTTLVVLASASLSTSVLNGQSPLVTRPINGSFVERRVHERWHNDPLRPDWPPFADVWTDVRIDSTTTDASGRATFVRAASMMSVLSAVLHLSPAAPGRTIAVGAPLPPNAPIADVQNHRALWDIVALFHPDRLAIGGRWTDTLAFGDTVGDEFQSLRGVRVSVIVGDTIIDGRAAWIVRDSAAVRYDDRWRSDVALNGTPVSVGRSARGFIRGRQVVDPALTVLLTRHDTAAWAGVATQFSPDGRTFSVPVHYERTAQLTLVDAAIHAVHDAARRASISADLTAANVARLRRTTPQSLRAAIASGDTATAVYALGYGRMPRQIDMNTMRFLIGILSNPDRAFAYNAPLAYISGDAYAAILGPGLPAITPDTAHWWCAPAVCALLAAQWDQPTEPPLRDLALAMHFALDPRRWADTVRTHAATDPTFSGVAELARGVGATGPAASHASIPALEAPWPAWEQWMNGRSPGYPQFKFGDQDTTPTAHPGVRFEETHARALRVQQVITGRDFVDEFRRDLAAATSDTARLVYRTMLIGLDAYHPTIPELATRYLNGTWADRASAWTELSPHFSTAGHADSATTTDLQNRLLSVLLDGDPPWPSLGGAPNGIGFSPRGPSRLTVRPEDSLHVVNNALTAAVRAEWTSRFSLVPDPGYPPAIDPAWPAVLRVSAVDAIGPFARLRWGYSNQTGRGGHGGEVYLLRSENGWLFLFANAYIAD